MKQIFDWLREQIENKSNYEPVDYDYCDMACSGEQGFIAREDALDAINEAEAKWEAEVKVCEWKQEKYLNFALSTCTTSCGKRYDISEDFKFCPYCGKPIKISEVE